MEKSRLYLGIIVLNCIAACYMLPSGRRRSRSASDDESSYYANVDWWSVGQDELKQTLTEGLQMGVAKNVILFLGDGMGLSTVTAARWYNEQSRGLSGRDSLLAWDKFPHTALSRTYSSDYMIPDSASTATAFLCGVKANVYTLGVNNNVGQGQCLAVEGNEVKSILKHAIDMGKWTGLVTTTRVTHATPAAAYASTAHREWETDFDTPLEYHGVCADTASQLIDEDYSKQIKVILGGGRRSFYPEEMADPEYGTPGRRLDGRNLVDEWQLQKVQMTVLQEHVKYVMNRTDFLNVDLDSVEYLMGLFEPSHMQFETQRLDPQSPGWDEPSIAEMTEAAIKVLSRNEQGFFLLVEAGRIDHGHHLNWAMNALNETVALSDAVTMAIELVDPKDTLTVVTADHSHSFSMNGYTSIGTDILGLSDTFVALDDKPYLTLSYINGPGFAYHRVDSQQLGGNEIPRRNLENDTDIGKPGYYYDAGFFNEYETHSGEDVAVYAQGPMSHLFNGVHEQNYIAHAMMYASCVGPNKDHCSKPWEYPGCPDESHTASKATLKSISMYMSLALLLLVYLRFE